MFKQELLNFLVSIEDSKELDEDYLSYFKQTHADDISYETGHSMLVQCCEVWINYDRFTWEIISIMSNVRNIISTNTFPSIYEDNKSKILSIYSDTENRVRFLTNEMNKSSSLPLDMLNKQILESVAGEKLMFKELFENSNIDWFSDL